MFKTPYCALPAVVAAFLSMSPRTGTAQTSQPLKHAGGPTTGAITAADAMTRVYIVADDSMMGRRSGTAGGLKGTAYIEREVRRLGLVPAGDNGTFFQAVPLYTRSFDTSSLLAAGTTPVTGGKDYYPLHPGGAARPVDGAQIIFAGNSADPTNLIPAAQAVGKVVLVAGPPAGVSARYPGAAAFMVVVAEPVLPQLRRAVMSEATLMKSDADTVSKPLTIALPAASVAMFLGVPVANAGPAPSAALSGVRSGSKPSTPPRETLWRCCREVTPGFEVSTSRSALTTTTSEHAQRDRSITIRYALSTRWPRGSTSREPGSCLVFRGVVSRRQSGRRSW